MSRIQTPDPFIGKKIQDIQKSGAKIEGFNPVGMNIKDVIARGANVQHEGVSHGATGSWEADVVRDHPYLTAPLRPLSAIGEGVVDAAKGIASTFAPPQTQWEKDIAGITIPGLPAMGMPLIAAKRMLVDPTAATAEKAKTAETLSEKIGYTLATGLGPVGAFAAHAGERLGHGQVGQLAGELLAGATIPALAGEASTAALNVKIPTRSLTPVQMDASLGSLATPGIKAKGVSPYKIGAESRQGLQQAFHELGVDPQALPAKNTSRTTNEMVIGGTDADLARVNAVLKAEHDAKIAAGKLPEGTPFHPEESIQLAVADRLVDIYHRPINNAVETFAEVKRPDVKAKIYNDLKQLAEAENVRNPALSAAFENAAKQVAGTADTVAAINALKVKANKMPNRRYSGGPSQQIAADVSTAEAQAELASSARRHLYPEVEQIGKLNGKPMTGELVKAGKRESYAIAMRDGMYDKWTKAAYAQAPADLENWWQRTIRGHSESIPSFRRASAANAAVRVLQGVEKPMAEFNKLLREGTGSLKGFVPENAVVTPRREIAAVSEHPQGGFEMNVTTTPIVDPYGPGYRINEPRH